VAASDGSTPSGGLYVEAIDTTGFNDYGTEPRIVSVLIRDGKGKLQIRDSKSDIPDGRPVPAPPRYELKRAAFDPYLSATIIQRAEALRSGVRGAVIAFSASPTRVTKSASGDSYEAKTELSLKGGGDLSGRAFIFYAERITLESPNPEENGDSKLVGLLTFDGEHREVDTSNNRCFDVRSMS